jgi:hypothetical protein
MRLAGRARLGFYPLPLPEAKRIRKCLAFSDEQCCALDPCVGDGAAFAEIASDKGVGVWRYGVELDAGRAEQAGAKGIQVIHGNCFDVQCPVESFSLIYLNPPYDFEIGEERSQRMERLFLEQVYRWLKRSGVLVMVIPGRYLHDCSQILAHQFREVRVHRLTEPESAKYKQIVVMGVRRTRAERDRVQDAEITRARMQFESLATDPERISTLPAEPDHLYAVPPGDAVRMPIPNGEGDVSAIRNPTSSVKFAAIAGRASRAERVWAEVANSLSVPVLTIKNLIVHRVLKLYDPTVTEKSFRNLCRRYGSLVNYEFLNRETREWLQSSMDFVRASGESASRRLMPLRKHANIVRQCTKCGHAIRGNVFFSHIKKCGSKRSESTDQHGAARGLS